MVIICPLLDWGLSKVAVKQANPLHKVKMQVGVNERSSSEEIYTLTLKKLLTLSVRCPYLNRHRWSRRVA